MLNTKSFLVLQISYCPDGLLQVNGMNVIVKVQFGSKNVIAPANKSSNSLKDIVQYVTVTYNHSCSFTSRVAMASLFS